MSWKSLPSDLVILNMRTYLRQQLPRRKRMERKSKDGILELISPKLEMVVAVEEDVVVDFAEVAVAEVAVAVEEEDVGEVQVLFVI